MRVALLKRPINHFKLFPQSRHQVLRASCPNIHTVLWRQNLIRAGDVTVCYKLYVDCSWKLFNFRNDGEIEVIQQKMNEYLLVNLDSLSKQGSVAKRFLISVKKRPCYNTVGLASNLFTNVALVLGRDVHKRRSKIVIPHTQGVKYWLFGWP